MSECPLISYVVALDAEAQPIIRYYKLKRVHDIAPFAVYKNEDKQLIVCGIGKHNATVATGYLAGLSNTGSRAWLNVGIAGGNVAGLGDMMLANSILDQEAGRCYYPSLCFDLDFPQTKIITLNKPDTNYQEGALYDMEAAGFFAAASRFSTSELVHSCKIISDNSHQGVNDISKESVLALVESCVGKIDNVTQALINLVKQIKPDQDAEQAISLLVEKFHFTTSQQNTLRTLIQNWVAINGKTGLSDLCRIEAKNSRQYLDTLESQIKSQPVIY